MTATANRTSDRVILGQLARLQGKRFARHPLFLIAVLLGIVALVAKVDDAPLNDGAYSSGFFPAFMFGVLGLIVAYRLTRTEEAALSVLPSAPTSATTRTLALCIACLVPAIAAGIWLVVSVIGWQVAPPSGQLVDAVPVVELIAWQLGSTVVAAFGGSVLGVAVGRWWTFPGAGVLAAVVLTLVCVAGVNLIYSDPEGMLAKIAGGVIPFTDWIVLSENADQEIVAVRPGSPIGHLIYQLALCGLAMWAAVIKGAEGAERSRWSRNGTIFALVALGGLLWTVLG